LAPETRKPAKAAASRKAKTDPKPKTAAPVDEGQIIDDLDEGRLRMRGRARAILGITGEETGRPSMLAAAGTVGWYPVIALGLLVLVDQFQDCLLLILGPEISQTLGISKGLLAFLGILKTFTVMAATLPLAAYVQRGRRRAMTATATGLAFALATMLCAFVANLWGLLGLLVVNGASSGSTLSVHPSLLVDSYPPEARVRVLSLYRAAVAVGTVVAPLLIVVVTVAADLTWRTAFLVLGLVSLAAVIVSIRLRDHGYGALDTDEIRREVRAQSDTSDTSDTGDTGDTDDTGAVGRLGEDGEAVHPATELGFFEIIQRVLLVPTFVRLVAAWAAVGMLSFPFYTYLFFYLDNRWNMGVEGRSLFLALIALVSIPCVLAFGSLGEGLYRRDPGRMMRLVGLTTGLIVIGLVVGVESPIFVVMILGFAVVSGAAAVLAPALYMVTLSVVPPTMRPHAAGLAGLIAAGAGSIGGLLILSSIGGRYGTGNALVVLALPIALGAWTLYRAGAQTTADIDHVIDDVVEHEEIAVLRSQHRHLPMLACRHIEFAYGQLQVLFDVDFTVDEGERVALLGTNGAGKSTLLRVVSGLGLPSRGAVHFQGADITYLDAERRLDLGITQIPGGRAIFGPLSVADNLRVYGHSLGRDRKSLQRGIDATFEAFPRLDERRNQLATSLSGGEQQMLALGKAFILQPQLLLIDELSLGLAPKIVGELLAMVRRINETGTAIVLVEQSLNIALSIVDHAYFMEKGEIRFDGPAPDLLGRPDLLRSVFLEGAAKGLG